MLKYTVLFTGLFCLVNSQRPWHAGSSNRMPMVLPQYIDERLAAEQANQAAQAGQAPVQPGQTIQPNIGVQPNIGIESNLGVQPEQAFQPGQTVQPNIGVQPTQVICVLPGPGQAIRPAQGPQGIPAFGSDVASRIDGSSVVNNVITARPTVLSTTFATTTINPADLPVDAHGDIDLINRIKTWPREKQPFWYLNWQAIQAHRGDVNNQATQVQPNPRSFFAG